MDSKSSHALDGYQVTLLDRQDDRDSDFDEDEFMDMIDNDPALDGYREQRLHQLEQQMSLAKKNLESGGGYGKVLTVSGEKELLEKTTASGNEKKLSIVHFYEPDFQRCKIMTNKLQELAPRHLSTQFLQIKASDAPFLVTRMNIRVLPCVVGFANGQETVRLVGFEQLGNSDNFSLQTLESRLLLGGVLTHSNSQSVRSRANGRIKPGRDYEDEGDDDM